MKFLLNIYLYLMLPRFVSSLWHRNICNWMNCKLLLSPPKQRVHLFVFRWFFMQNDAAFAVFPAYIWSSIQMTLDRIGGGAYDYVRYIVFAVSTLPWQQQQNKCHFFINSVNLSLHCWIFLVTFNLRQCTSWPHILLVLLIMTATHNVSVWISNVCGHFSVI